MASVLHLGRSEVLDVNVPPYIDPTERGSYDTDELDELERRAPDETPRCVGRYVVQTVTGYQIEMPMGRRGSRQGPGIPTHLSAHVCDSLVLYRVVGTFRSEDRCRGRDRVSRRNAPQAAIDAAVALAARLNEADRDTA